MTKNGVGEVVEMACEEHPRGFRLKQAYLLLTRQCNLSCSHCIRSSTPFNTEFMDYQLALHVIRELVTISEDSVLLISGGEPTLHRDFQSIVSFASEKFKQVVINSNGLRLRPLREVAIFPTVSVQISIDGGKAEHDAIRGEGTFERTIRNINELAESGLSVTVATTVTNSNIESIHDLDSVLENIAFERWNIKRVVGSGRANDADDISTGKWNEFVGCIKVSSKNKKRLRVSYMFSDESIRSAGSVEESTPSYSSNCGTGRSKFYINPNGTVYPCACMEDRIVASFKEQNIREIVGVLSQQEIEPHKSSVCRVCPAWQACRGGCPGAAMRTFSPSLGDPRCPLASAGREDAGLLNVT
ncbi:radical SAM protein [Alcanivorax sp. IL3]|uniref:radical SAM protein n=1 Tax=unclassified Alcanivorax TaxID=2638842 RepID=UPI0039C26E02